MTNTAVPMQHTFGQEVSLRDSIKRALQGLFDELGKETPANVYNIVLEQFELPLLQKIMEYTRNNQSRAAKILGLSRGTLRKKLKTYDML